MLITKYHLHTTAAKQIQNYQTKFGKLETTIKYKLDNVNTKHLKILKRVLHTHTWR